MRIPREQGALVALVIWFVAGVVLFFLLLPIPSEMAIDAPKGISCQWYAVGRGGWSCARWGDFSSQPYLTLGVLLVSFLGAFWFSRYGDQTQTPFMFYFVGQIGFVVCFAGAIRLVYFVQGKVSPEHAKVSAIAIGCAVVSMFAFGLYLVYLHRKQANRLRS